MRFHNIGVLCAFMFALALPLRAQTTYGKIVGNARDVSGAVVTGVRVTSPTNGRAKPIRRRPTISAPTRSIR